MSRPTADKIRPALIVHADWGSHPGKRWMAKAELRGNDYQVGQVEPVGDLDSFLKRIQASAGNQGWILIGFDFPIGLPYAYAQRAGIHNFLEALPKFGRGNWRDFYQVSATVDDISIYRPFYPSRPGGTSQQDLINQLGFQAMAGLRRKCEQAPPQERPAAPLFWTLGAQQVGKAALNGWQRVLVPGLNNPTLDVVIWPFSGRLDDLIQPGRIVLAETYPAQYLREMVPVTAHQRFSKRRQGDRMEACKRLIQYVENNSIQLQPDLERSMREGFGSENEGDDPFDAAIGVLGMIRYFSGRETISEPSDPKIRTIEGWILGLAAE